MVKCELCKETIPELFLGKLKGTMVQEKGKKRYHHVCFNCQKTHKDLRKELKID